MPKERSGGALVYRMEHGVPFFLLLLYPFSNRSKREYWDFPKGHVEQQETEEQTVRREVLEETGIEDLVFDKRFREIIQYFFQVKGDKIFKTVVFYLAKTNTRQVQISEEHLGFQWLPYERALKQVRFINAKQLLNKAHSLLSRKGKTGGAKYSQERRN